MGLYIRKIVSNATFYIFLALLIFSFPKAIYESAEFERRAIFTTFGFDKSEKGYEVTGLVLAQSEPQHISSNTQMVSAEGRDVSEALYKMSVNLGKEIGFAHCDTFIISDSLKDDDVAKILDFCIRGSSLSQNSKLLTCKGSAKEVIKVNMEKKDQIGTSLARSITNSSDYLSITDMDLKEFYNRYYSKSGFAWMTVVEVKEEEEESKENGGQGASSTSGGSSATTGGMEQPNKSIKSEGQVALYKKGKLKYILEDDVANFLNIMNPYSQMGYIYLENIQDGDKLIEKISLQIVQKSTDRDYYVQDGEVVCDVKIKLYLNVLSLRTDDIDVYEISETETHITDAVKNAVNEYMQNNKDKLMEICEEIKTDVYQISNRIYQFENKYWKESISQEEKDNCFIENVKINLKLDIESKL